MRFGVNLWGLKRQLRRDRKGLFQQLKTLGYRYVEPCLVIGDGMPELSEDLSLEQLDITLRTAKACGLEAENVHLIVIEEEKVEETLLKLAQTYAFRHFVFLLPAEVTEEGYRAFAERLCRYAKLVEPYGISLLVHNEKYEIAGTIDGKPALIRLLEYCDGSVKAQVDVGWVTAGGEDPETFLWTYKEHIASIHYKDMDETYNEVPFGQGILDKEAVFQFARAEECVQYLDQDSYEEDPHPQLKYAMEWFQSVQQ